jgi:hypothetical protein
MSFTLKQFLNKDVDRILKERKLRMPKNVSFEDEEDSVGFYDDDGGYWDSEEEYNKHQEEIAGEENYDEDEEDVDFETDHDTDPASWSVRPLSDDELDDEENENPNRQGMIRKVDDAHLVYKRQTESGGYEELWIYKTGDANRSELDIRHDILAGTDIDPSKTQSEDGSQQYELWTSGNVQFIYISGLPN